MNNHFDILIIGGGAVGCAVARELSRYDVSIALLEQEADVAAGASGRNSAVVHAGFNNKPGSLMAKLCVEGNRGFEAACRELDVPYRKTGKLLVAFDQADLDTLARLKAQGEENGCQGLRLLTQEELRAKLPQVGGIGALESPETAVFDPFQYTVALAENALQNGVQFFLNTKVTAIQRTSEGFRVTAGERVFTARRLVNCAGLHSAEVSALAGLDRYAIYPCRGEYFILDKTDVLPMPIYPAPKAGIGGLGVHLTPTIHGNLIIGPSAEYIEDPADTASTQAVMDQLWTEAQQLLPGLQGRQIIGSYAGIRPKQAPPGEGGFRDFVIREEVSCPGLVNLIGIESPGLTASLPIGRMVAGILSLSMDMTKKKNFDPTRKGITRFRDQSPEGQAQLIAQNPDYGEVVCRCQTVTKAEIRQAIENPLEARTISAIKYRAWATTGRCSGGYCLPKIAEILTNEYGMSPEEITHRGDGSHLFAGRVKG
ncbi:MAG: NAD(P)/FAD-dependent oxidoreductase [Ruminiclostridium sp.]|nr:NAD(P)/FAD-dependent oxidoreductase [Ruminiclostridium sp.]